MNWFKRKKEPLMPGKVQLRSGEYHPFGMLADYVPLQNGELQLYRAVREAVPVVDAAIYKLIRMTGGGGCHLSRPDGAAAAADISADRAHRPGAAGDQRLFGLLSGFSAGLRPGHR